MVKYIVYTDLEWKGILILIGFGGNTGLFQLHVSPTVTCRIKDNPLRMHKTQPIENIYPCQNIDNSAIKKIFPVNHNFDKIIIAMEFLKSLDF